MRLIKTIPQQLFEPVKAESGVAIRPILAEATTAILRSILESSDQGVLFTDLEHRTLACNRRFGEIFDVDLQEAVRSEAEQLRRRVEHLIPDPKSWRQMLDRVYASPSEEFTDEQLLLKSPRIVVRRWTGPVYDDSGNLHGRLWTFLDITKDIRRQRMQEVLYEISTFNDPDPSVAYGYILQRISDFYDGTTAVLSIRNYNRMDYRCIRGPHSILKHLKGVDLKDSYCKITIKSPEPVVIQDTRKHPEAKRLIASRIGYFTRYMGVPIRSSLGDAIGTVCILDRRSSSALDDEDARFLSLLAMRIGTEVARESYLRERLDEQREVLEQQRQDLETTHQVLNAMNSALLLMGQQLTIEELLSKQVELLQGLLGFESAALFLSGEGARAYAGYGLGVQARKPHKLKIASSISDRLGSGNLLLEGVRAREEFPSLDSEHVLVTGLRHDGKLAAILALGSNEKCRVNDRHQTTHLAALIDQVRILLATHWLHGQLVEAHGELRGAHLRLVQAEKLSVVGTLAAGVAHDIKNILASLSIEMTFADQQPEATLASVKEQLDRFSVLAHRLLSYARPRLMAQQPVQMEDVLSRVLALTSAQLKIMNVGLTTSIDPSLPEIIGDPHQLEHLFVNLVMNAVQSMPVEGGALTLKALRLRNAIEIVVCDTGKGMAKETMRTLFQPFNSTRSEGFGLGLYSCRRIVEEHGGNIEVKSKLGHGTSFRILLPIPRAGKEKR